MRAPPDFFNPSLNRSALRVPTGGFVPPAMASLHLTRRTASLFNPSWQRRP
jgi:hypothetical protein